MSEACFYAGAVMHARLVPFRHTFRYRVFSMLIDLADMPRAFGFAHNRFALLSFHDRDHGEGDGRPLREWALAQLRCAGFAADERWRIRLLCFPRLLGYVFNPLAIYFCEDGTGQIRALIHQVSNTFGERHSYVLPADDAQIRQRCDKRFHVSPFMPVDGGYRFDLDVPDEKLRIRIDNLAPDGSPRLVATQHGRRRPFNSATLFRLFAAHPLMTLKVMAAIHFEALRLWRKGARYHPKPAPPRNSITLTSAAE